jgi:glutamate synthase (NADPH/NADH) large chain
MSGDANDYVAKGLSGGRIVLRPPHGTEFESNLNIIAGNVVAYGATSGELFIAGVVGERFCVRNSGATVVVEGVGDHALEYMTGGLVAILGNTGRNVGAGMSGGRAFVLDLDHALVNKSALSSGELLLEPLSESSARDLHELIESHARETGSEHASALLASWESSLTRFTEVIPRDFRVVTEIREDARARGVDPDGAETWELIEEATNG